MTASEYHRTPHSSINNCHLSVRTRRVMSPTPRVSRVERHPSLSPTVRKSGFLDCTLPPASIFRLLGNSPDLFSFPFNVGSLFSVDFLVDGHSGHTGLTSALALTSLACYCASFFRWQGKGSVIVVIVTAAVSGGPFQFLLALARVLKFHLCFRLCARVFGDGSKPFLAQLNVCHFSIQYVIYINRKKTAQWLPVDKP